MKYNDLAIGFFRLIFISNFFLLVIEMNILDFTFYTHLFFIYSSAVYVHVC